MLTRLDAVPVTPLAPAEGAGAIQAVGDGRQAVFQRTLQALVGQSLQAEVLSKYNDGSFLVRVAGSAARMQLPPGVRVGAELPLTVIAASPRPTFQLGGSQPALVYSDPPATADAPHYTPGLASQANPGAPLAPRTGAAPSGPPASPPTASPAPPATGAPLAPGATPESGPARTAVADAPPAAAPELAAGAAPAEARKPPSPAAALLGKAPLTPASQLPELDPATPPPTLSPAARALTSVLAAAPSPSGTPVILNGKAPLVAAGPPQPAQLAHTLRDTLEHSGLFYESHVSDWVQGQRGLPQLMQEPQMQRAALAAETAAHAATAGPDLAAAQLINQQLHAHEQARVQWQGEAWPGQAMQWEIRREPREDQGRRQGEPDDGAPPQVWRSGVRFRFPLLGKVAATVTLVGGQVQIQVQTDTAASAGTLRAYAGRLELAMEAAGAPLSSLTIASEDGHES